MKKKIDSAIERKCKQCGSNLITGGVCPNCDIPIVISHSNKLVARRNYDRVISLLYKAMYSDYQLQYKDLKTIIDYIMEEYK